MFVASSSPSATPAAVPSTPTAAPCTTKTAMIDAGLAPRVRRMAISARFSVTVITSVETRLKAATATMSTRMSAIMRFWICTDSNQMRLLRVHSRMTHPGSRACSSACATAGAA